MSFEKLLDISLWVSLAGAVAAFLIKHLILEKRD